MQIDLDIQDDRWQGLELVDLLDVALRETCGHLSLDPDSCELSVLACDDATISRLNADFRDKPVPTNVLSWPAQSLAPDGPGCPPPPPEPDVFGALPLGDIALSFDTCRREADAAGKQLADHVAHLVVHGILHLLGHDHVRDADATLMERREVEILGRLGLDDPYRDMDGQ